MPNRTVILIIAAIQVLVMGVLIVWIVRPRYAVSFSPLSRADVQMSTTSDRLRYYYDLTSEVDTFVPEWLPYTPQYERNTDRLNDRFDYGHAKPAGTYRIITLGDSWTFGMHVNTRDNYSERLEDMLRHALESGSIRCEGVERFDVINLGLGGYDIEYMVESLRLRGMVYDPDLIVPLIKNDDFTIVNEIWQPRIAAYQEQYGNLDAKIVDGEVLNPRQEIADRVVAEISSEHTQKELNDRSAAALTFLNTFYGNKILLFVYAVSDSQIEILRSYVRDRGNSHIHIEPLLTPAEKVPHDEHPGVAGHARFAESLFRTLIQERVLPCTTVS